MSRAEQIVHDAIYGTKLIEPEMRTLLANDSWAISGKAVAALKARGLLEGAPQEPPCGKGQCVGECGEHGVNLMRDMGYYESSPEAIAARPAAARDDREKLDALAAAQERLRVAEARVDLIREMEDALEVGTLLRLRMSFGLLVGDPIQLADMKLRPAEVEVLTEGLLIVRRNAMEDVERCKARLEGMLK
ncbi:hypothetical protein MUN78_10290 [Leucobacter allii]|uniref:Uncharacterized protein n=1 Tax=Leucobacter allii TaxID=2932247 RepID=A0ABY4FHD6_9MICO|nr:hypothetical protein [Leucobacter allii]UOQ56092.1 hypothetical protein MUN78_10290 [Leucobacter allii]